MADRFDAIVRFAEIGEFIDAPVKTYSSGMYMRLGSPSPSHVDPDVLLVDEVLAVGDEAFTHKCLDRFAVPAPAEDDRTRDAHAGSRHQVMRRGLWLDHGRLRAHGDPKRVVDAYLLDVAGHRRPEPGPPRRRRRRTGAAVTHGRGRPLGLPRGDHRAGRARHADGQPLHVFQIRRADADSRDVRAARPLTDFVFGVAVTRPTACVVRHQYVGRGRVPRTDGETRFLPWRSTRWVSSTAPTGSTSPCTGQDGVPYDYHRLSTRSRHLAGEGHEDLSGEALVGVLRRRRGVGPARTAT